MFSLLGLPDAFVSGMSVGSLGDHVCLGSVSWPLVFACALTIAVP